jgi:glycine hydroxymethyltransferase
MDSLKRLSSQVYHEGIWDALKKQDERVYQLIIREYERLQNTLQLIAAENLCTRAVLAALGSIVQNKTTEGFPRARFHGGCEVVDDIEELAVARAKETFKAQYANVQPHSGTAANQIVLVALLDSGDRILSLELNQGGHVSHGANVSFGGKFFNVENYYVDRQTFRLDYESIRQKAMEFKPRLIICGGSAYARTIDFQQFRRIADEVGAYLMADISHIAGLIIAGAHPSPIDAAHFSTTSTYKPGGPRGGLILMGKDFDREIEVSGKKTTLWRLIQKTTFPGVQGTPYLNNIAAKAIFFKETLSEEYRSRQFKILINIANLREGMTGAIAQECLEDCGIIINKNRLPYDTRSAAVASGARLGTPIVTRNGMGPEQMDIIAGLFDTVLREVKLISEREYDIEDSLKEDTRRKIMELCHEFPMS